MIINIYEYWNNRQKSLSIIKNKFSNYKINLLPKNNVKLLAKQSRDII